MKQFILLGFISLTFANVTYDTSKHCALSQIKSPQDCYLYSGTWSSNTCIQKTCSEFAFESDCLYGIPFADKNCKWENSTCKDYTPVCTDFKSEAECAYPRPRMDCVWVDSCKSFTQCSDYQPRQLACSYASSPTQKCQITDDGIGCENYTTKQCSRFSDQSLCIYATNSFCFWDGTCKELITCSQIQNSDQCTFQYSDNCIYDTTCRDRVCSDTTNELECMEIETIATSMRTICKWDTSLSICVEAENLSFLNESQCFLQTRFNYTWDGSKCIPCSGDEIPSSESSSSPSSESASSTSESNSGLSSQQNSDSSTTSSESNSNSNSSYENNSNSDSEAKLDPIPQTADCVIFGMIASLLMIFI